MRGSYRVWAGASAGFLLGVLLPAALSWPVLRYHPVARAWEWSTTAGGPAPMLYYGQLLWGLAGGLAGAAAGWATTRFGSREPDHLLWGGWLLAAAAAFAAYFTWHHWPG